MVFIFDTITSVETETLDRRYDIGVRGQGQINLKSVLKSVLWLVSYFTFLMEGIHDWHNSCLWCVDDTEGFELLIWPLSQRSRSNIRKIRLYGLLCQLLLMF